MQDRDTDDSGTSNSVKIKAQNEIMTDGETEYPQVAATVPLVIKGIQVKTNLAEFVQPECSEGERENTAPKKRGGQRRKNYYLKSKLRKSSRGHVPLKPEKDDHVWSLEEKEALLAAVKKYGHLDMEHLCQAVPNKTAYAIRTMITKWWRRAAVVRQNEIDGRPKLDRRFKDCRNQPKKRKNSKGASSKLSPIEEWIEEFRKACSAAAYRETKTLAKAMLFISLFEKHPDPADCGGIDFSAIYDYLYRILMGYPPKTLNEPTTKYFLNMMDGFTAKIEDGDFHGQIFHLQSVRCISLKPTTIKQYGSKEENDKRCAEAVDLWIKELLEVDGFDSLGTGMSLLKLK